MARLGIQVQQKLLICSPPDRLLKKGINALPTLGDGRQSGTSESPSILHVSPESAAGGDLGIIKQETK